MFQAFHMFQALQVFQLLQSFRFGPVGRRRGGHEGLWERRY